MKKKKEKQKNILGLVFELIGSLIAFYGIVVILFIGFSHWFNTAFVIAGVLLFAIGLAVPKIKEWVQGTSYKKFNDRKCALIIVICLLCLCLINFGIFEGKVIKFANSDPDSDACWVIVLGAKVKPGNIPSLEYSVRLKAAADYINSRAAEAKQGSASGKSNVRLILTGGRGADEPASESSIGYSYIRSLIKIGNTPDSAISEDRIYLEEKSTSTSENLRFAREIIEAAGGSATDSVVIVSSSFHLYRASVLALEEGFTDTSYMGSTGLRILMPFYYVREYAAFVRERL